MPDIESRMIESGSGVHFPLSAEVIEKVGRAGVYEIILGTSQGPVRVPAAVT